MYKAKIAIASGTKIARAVAETLKPLSESARRPSTKCEIGFKPAIVLYVPLIVSRGKNALEKNNKINSNGNVPCTASDEPVLSATDDIKAPTARAINAPLMIIAMMPGTPAETSAPNGNSTNTKTAVSSAPNKTLPAIRQNKIESREVGDASRRSKKPFSMSVASAAAPVTEPNNTPWVIVPAS